MCYIVGAVHGGYDVVDPNYCRTQRDASQTLTRASAWHRKAQGYFARSVGDDEVMEDRTYGVTAGQKSGSDECGGRPHWMTSEANMPQVLSDSQWGGLAR